MVNKLGRPSKAAQRRAEILAATAAVVAREGLADTTMAKVAEQAGVRRTLVFHYFGERRSLIDAFIDQVVTAYGDQQILGDRTLTIETRLERAFEPGHYATHDDLVVWAELVALAARDTSIRRQLRTLWHQRWLPMLEQELRAARPSARAAKVSEVAYTIACLVEGHWNLQLQGIDQPTRRRQAQTSARLLLDSLSHG